MSIEKAFEKYTKTTYKRGRCQINCIKGLWGVDCAGIAEALREARHYFRQYFIDGEYEDKPAITIIHSVNSLISKEATLEMARKQLGDTVRITIIDEVDMYIDPTEALKPFVIEAMDHSLEAKYLDPNNKPCYRRFEKN